MAPAASELGVGKRGYVTAAGWPRHGRRMKASLAGVRSGRSRIGWKMDLGVMPRWEPGSRQLFGDEVPDGLHDLGGLFGVRVMARMLDDLQARGGSRRPELLDSVALLFQQR